LEIIPFSEIKGRLTDARSMIDTAQRRAASTADPEHPATNEGYGFHKGPCPDEDNE
jgi:hypothetical protein